MGSPKGFTRNLPIFATLLVVRNAAGADILRATAVAVMVEAKTSSSRSAALRFNIYHLLSGFSDRNILLVS